MGFSQPVAPGTSSQVLEPLAKLQTCLCVFAQQERAANSTFYNRNLFSSNFGVDLFYFIFFRMNFTTAAVALPTAHQQYMCVLIGATLL